MVESEQNAIDGVDQAFGPVVSGQKEDITVNPVDSGTVSSTTDSHPQDKVDLGPAPAKQAPPGGAGTLPFREVMIVFGGLLLGTFLSSLDQTIVNVCTTKIASEFNSLTEIPWIGTAYFLTMTACQPL